MQEIKPVNLKGALITIAVMAIFMIAIGGYNIIQKSQESQEKAAQRETREAPLLFANQTRAAMQAGGSSSDFETVRNDCGMCGTNSVVGGWETEDGRALILSSDGTFTAIVDDSPMIGKWELGGGELCLLQATGAESCFTYQQKTDAMKLNNAIYIRR